MNTSSPVIHPPFPDIANIDREIESLSFAWTLHAEGTVQCDSTDPTDKCSHHTTQSLFWRLRIHSDDINEETGFIIDSRLLAPLAHHILHCNNTSCEKMAARLAIAVHDVVRKELPCVVQVDAFVSGHKGSGVKCTFPIF